MSEVVLYHVYNSKTGLLPEGRIGKNVVKINFLDGLTETLEIPYVAVQETREVPGRLSIFLNRLSVLIAAIGLVMILTAYAPEISGFAKNIAEKAGNYKLSSQEVQSLSSVHEKEEYQPPYDPKLPKTNKIIILTIGIDSEVQESTYENYEEALKKGIWRVSDFGAPDSRKMPTIFAAHRYGYLAWTWNFRKTSSFMNLPKVKVGDTVTIIWRQRKYIYEVYAEDKGEEVSDYTADLILYTCESLTGPIRIFKYARLLEV